MSYQPPPSGPPRSTPIPGQNAPIVGDGQALTPEQFLGTQPGANAAPSSHEFQPYNPVASPKATKSRNWGLRFIVLLIILPTVIGIGVGVWAVLKAKDAVETARERTEEGLSDKERSALGLADDEDSLMFGGGPAAVTAALDQGIPGEPTNFTEIILYPGYAFGTAQDQIRLDHLDRYQWQSGNVGEPSPQTSDVNAPNLVFKIAEVDWNAVGAIAAEAPTLANVEAGEVTHVIVNRNVFNEANEIIIRIYVLGPRGSGFVEATADGTFIRAL